MKVFWLSLCFVFFFSSDLVRADDIIENFSMVSPGVYRGARPSEDGLRYLQSLGIRVVVNLQGGDPESFLFGPIAEWLEPGEDPKNIAKEKALTKRLGMDFWHAPLNSFDAVSKHDEILIDQTLEVMRAGSLAGSQGAVFVHCEHGRDRTGLVVALYRVKFEGWDPIDAYIEWTDHGHGWLLLLSDELDDYFFKKAYSITEKRHSRR